MTSEIRTSLRALGSGREMLELENAICRKQIQDISKLQEFENSAELASLEELTTHARPNILAVLEQFGRIRRFDELLHSRFIEFFLTSREVTGEKSKALLNALIGKAKFFERGLPTQVSDTGDLSDTEIKSEAICEHGRADFKLLNVRHRFVLLIENKCLSREGHEQLERYWQDAERQHPGFAIGGLFLTLEGREPKTSRKYIAISYADIAQLLEDCSVPVEGDDSDLVFEQYASALRRWFVEDPQMKELAWSIYRKYPGATSYLSRDDVKPRGQIIEHLAGLLTGDDFEELKKVKNELWFVPRQWGPMDSLRHADTKEADGRLLIFWFGLYEGDCEPNVDLYLGVPPGANADLVRDLIDAVGRYAMPSSPGLQVNDRPQRMWTNLWGRRFVAKEELAKKERPEILDSIKLNWRRFLSEDLPKILDATSAALAHKLRKERDS